MQVMLHEDKKYYPSAEEVYGQETETLVMDEDAQPLEVPIIAPVKQKKFESEEQGARPHATEEFLATLMSNPELVRNVAVVGHLHHGKTSVMDMFVEQTHEIRHQWRSNERQMKFTDTRYDEQVSRVQGAASRAAASRVAALLLDQVLPMLVHSAHSSW